ncbi:MAG: hypothetical protein QW241_08535 [Candidatus Bathyarchaeia archaeon]
MMLLMGRSKHFNIRICVSFPQGYIEFLKGMIEAGEPEGISQAVRKCISIARKHINGGRA